LVGLKLPIVYYTFAIPVFFGGLEDGILEHSGTTFSVVELLKSSIGYPDSSLQLSATGMPLVAACVVLALMLSVLKTTEY